MQHSFLPCLRAQCVPILTEASEKEARFASGRRPCGGRPSTSKPKQFGDLRLTLKQTWAVAREGKSITRSLHLLNQTQQQEQERPSENKIFLPLLSFLFLVAYLFFKNYLQLFLPSPSLPCPPSLPPPPHNSSYYFLPPPKSPSRCAQNVCR